MQPELLGFLEDILDAIAHIESVTEGMQYEAFTNDRVVRESVQWNLIVIGEAVHRIRRHHPEIVKGIQSIDQIVGFRNNIVHGYDRIDHLTVWKVVDDRLSILKSDVGHIMGSADSSR
jgi:uncharacterized protein with HEPN domain